VGAGRTAAGGSRWRGLKEAHGGRGRAWTEQRKRGWIAAAVVTDSSSFLSFSFSLGLQPVVGSFDFNAAAEDGSVKGLWVFGMPAASSWQSMAGQRR
jgi:hypothetical protein